MPDYVHARHDIGICSTTKSTDVGLMLVTQKVKGLDVPLYRTVTERYLKNQYYAGAPDYGALDPQSELPIIMDDWRSGFGLEVAASADPQRYYSSIGMDMRHRGQAILGWDPTAITPITRTATSWVSPINFKDNGVWAAETQAYDGNTGTAATCAYTAPAWTGFLELYVPTVQCSKIRFWYANSGSAGTPSIDVDLYYGGVWNHLYSGAAALGQWVEQALGSPESVTAARVRITVDGSGARTAQLFEFEFYSDDTTTGRGRAFADFNNELYVAWGNALLKLDAGGSTLATKQAFCDAITDLEPFTDNNLYIACGTALNYSYCSTADAVTLSTAGTANYQFFCTVHTTSPTLYGNDGDNTLRSTVDPLNAGTAWSNPATAVGSAFYAITDLFTKAGALYIPKEDMIYYLDSSGNAQNDLAPRLASLTGTYSGKNAITDGQKIMYPAGDQGLLEIDDTTLTWRDPSDYCTNLSDFVGQVFAVHYDEKYWYAIVENASTAEVEILAGRTEIIDSTSRFVWHPIQEITLKGCECCHVSTKVAKRLWIASDDSTDSLYHMPLPTTYGDLTNDSNANFETAGHFITPWLHGGFKGEDKAWIKATATLGHTYSANVYFECWFQRPVDSATTWIGAGYFKGSSTQMMNTLYLAANTAGVNPVSPMLRFKITGLTDDTTKTPILLALDVRAILRPTHRVITECAVKCADGIKDKQGLQLDGTNADFIRDVLDEARDAGWPFTWYDLWGNTKYGIILPTDTESEVTAALKNENPEQYYYLRIQEVALA